MDKKQAADKPAAEAEYQNPEAAEPTAGAEPKEPTATASAASAASVTQAASDIPDFPELALFLAKSYGQMVKDRDHLKGVIDAGVQPYTEDMAIADLTAISVNYESERVQTSNISNVPQRVAELLDAGYVEKMNRRMRYEMKETVKEHAYLCWKIDVVETAMRERMDQMERAIFTRIYARGFTFSKLKKSYKKRLYNTQICKYKKAALEAISDELALAESSKTTTHEYVSRLKKEFTEEMQWEEKKNHAGRKETGKTDKSAAGR